MRGGMRFGKKGKLSPRYVRPFQMKKCVSSVAYKVELPPNFDGVHDIFHVLQLWKCVNDPLHTINYKLLDIQPNLTYEELLVQIMDRKEHQLKTKTIPSVNVLWRNHGLEEASWELKSDMRNRYLHLFE